MRKPTFLERRKLEQQALNPQAFQFDKFSDEWRNQVAFIVEDLLGPPRVDPISGKSSREFGSVPNNLWVVVEKAIKRDIGKNYLSNHLVVGNVFLEVTGFFHQEKSAENLLTGVESVFRIVDNLGHNPYFLGYMRSSYEDHVAQQIDLFNKRCQEHLLGYAYEDGQIIRFDSTYLFENAISPSLKLLSNESGFESACKEFRVALDNFRGRRYEDANVACQRSYESVLKCLLKQMGINYHDRDMLDSLIKKVELQKFLGSAEKMQVNLLKNYLLECLPKVRNDHGAHGKGPRGEITFSRISEFCINITASTIVLLMKCYRDHCAEDKLE